MCNWIHTINVLVCVTKMRLEAFSHHCEVLWLPPDSLLSISNQYGHLSLTAHLMTVCFKQFTYSPFTQGQDSEETYSTDSETLKKSYIDIWIQFQSSCLPYQHQVYRQTEWSSGMNVFYCIDLWSSQPFQCNPFDIFNTSSQSILHWN